MESTTKTKVFVIAGRKGGSGACFGRLRCWGLFLVPGLLSWASSVILEFQWTAQPFQKRRAWFIKTRNNPTTADDDDDDNEIYREGDVEGEREGTTATPRADSNEGYGNC